MSEHVGPSGEVWYAGQNRGIASRLNPTSGEVERIPLGKNSEPHGVIVGPDGAPWFTDGNQNGIVRVDPATKQIKIWPLPPERMPYTNLNTAVHRARALRYGRSIALKSRPADLARRE